MLPGIISTTLAIGSGTVRLPINVSSGGINALPLGWLALAFLGFVVFSVGLVAYVIGGSLSHRRAEQGYGSLGTILACLGVAVLIANLLSLPFFLIQMAQSSGNPLLSPGGLVYSVIILDGVLLAVLYVRIVHPCVLSWAQMGLTTGQFGERVLQGVGVGVVVIVGAALVEAALQAIGIHQTQEQMFAGVRSASLPQFIGVLLATAVLAPFTEETFFRGYIFTAARRTYGVAPAFFLSALLFALAHLNLQAFLPIFLIGLAFCYVYWKTGSLVPSMVAHAMNNALALIALYFFNQ